MRTTLPIAAILETSRASFTGTMTFPQVVAELGKLGIERYSVDLTQLCKTLYHANGETIVEPLLLDDAPAVAPTWAVDGFIAALRASQQRQINFPTFLRQSMAAGCASYWVFFNRRQAIYLSRGGDLHVEDFPPIR